MTNNKKMKKWIKIVRNRKNKNIWERVKGAKQDSLREMKKRMMTIPLKGELRNLFWKKKIVRVFKKKKLSLLMRMIINFIQFLRKLILDSNISEKKKMIIIIINFYFLIHICFFLLLRNFLFHVQISQNNYRYI